ncbi:hypothetical protein KY386_00355 [Candidatus Parcubacteria bacterium]|nr:hypothetical protein [Candidatus Parcubacteria bacterium]
MARKMLMAAFSTPEAADQAIYELEHFGYAPREISVISKHRQYKTRGHAGQEFAKGAGAGAVTGGAVGGLAGLLAGIGVVPALAGLFIGGPVAAALGLAGAAATTASGAMTGAAAGGLIGALTGLGLSQKTAEAYDETVRQGGVVIGLNQRAEGVDDIRAILEKHGAHNVHGIEMRDVAHDHEPADERIRRREPVFGEEMSVRPSDRDDS